jgi:hypothetical protein
MNIRSSNPPQNAWPSTVVALGFFLALYGDCWLLAPESIFWQLLADTAASMSSRVNCAFQVSMPLNLASRARSTQAPIRIASAACCFAALAGPFVTLPSITRSAAKTVGFGASRGGPNTGLFRQGVATFAMSSNVKANPFGNGDGIVIPAPSGTADSVLIFMHGLGDTASGWASGMYSHCGSSCALPIDTCRGAHD